MNISAASFVRFFTVTVIAALIAGCASQGDADPALIPYKPKPGKGLVIVYRESTSLMREGWVGRITNFRHVLDDGHDFGHLSGGTFILDDASPGHHSFIAKDEDKKCVIDVEAGKTYFIKAELHTGMWTPNEVLETVDLGEGAEAIKDLEKAEPAE